MIQLAELTAVIYVRKSTVSDGKSTREQESECRNWCAVNKIHVDKVFKDEGKSASRYSKKQRDSWADLKAFLHPGHILVAWEASRATRDVAEGAALINLCADLSIPLAYSGRVLDPNSGDDRFMGGLDFLLAARESDIIRERTMRGMRGAAADGTPHARPPWGYRSVPRTPGSRPQWELDPEQAPRAKEAVRRVLDGESRKGVWKSMGATGYVPATPTSFGRWLTNPQIAGLRVYQGKVVGKGIWPALITEEQHNRLTADSKALTVTPGPASNHLCSGIAKCGKCGGPMRYCGPYNKKQKRKALYQCKLNGCTGRTQVLLDALVEQAVMRRLLNINPDAHGAETTEAVAAQKRIDELDADLTEWKEKAIREEVSAEMYAAVEKDRKQKIAALRPRTLVARVNLLTPEQWPHGTMDEKRQTVRALLDIKVYPMGSGKATMEDSKVVIKPL